MNLVSVPSIVCYQLTQNDLGGACGGIPGVIFIVWVGEVNMIGKTQTNTKYTSNGIQLKTSVFSGEFVWVEPMSVTSMNGVRVTEHERGARFNGGPHDDRARQALHSFLRPSFS